jgi:ribonuclease HI
MTLRAFTDGASRGNPGESGIGVVVKDEKGRIVLTFHGYIGLSTNNKAEYAALIALLERMRAIRCDRLIIHTDSELLVRQLSGRYKVRDAGLKSLHRKAATLLSAQSFATEVRHIPREENRDADRLANQAIDTKASAGSSSLPGRFHLEP